MSPKRFKINKIEEITEELKKLLKKHSHNSLINNENLSAETIIKQIDSYWVKLANKKFKNNEEHNIQKELAKKDSTIAKLVKEKCHLEIKIETLQIDLKYCLFLP